MTRTLNLLSATLVALSSVSGGLMARAAQPCGPNCHLEERTIYVTETVCETRKVPVTKYRCETQQRKMITYERVCEPVTVTRRYVHYVPQQKTKTVTYRVAIPEYKTVTREYTIQIPFCETRQGTRKVCRMVPVETTRTVCEDQGHWEERPCNCCNGCCHTQNVWVPKIVKREVPCTVMKPQMVDVPCQYTVTLYRPEKRSCTYQVCVPRYEECQKQVCYQVAVPVECEKTFHTTRYKSVPREHIVNCTVQVPYTEYEEVQVPVCRRVAKKIMVPVCDDCCP